MSISEDAVPTDTGARSVLINMSISTEPSIVGSENNW